MLTDRNFDELFDRFHRNIKGSDKGRLRETLIREDYETAAMLRDQIKTLKEKTKNYDKGKG